MCIPACLTGNHSPLHGIVSGDHILYNTGKHMSDVGLTVCCRRSVIECVGRTAFSKLQTLFEDVFILPELLDFFFTLDEVHICVDFFKHFSYLAAGMVSIRSVPAALRMKDWKYTSNLFPPLKNRKRLYSKTGIQPLYY